MAEQRVPDLEQMDEQQAQRLLAELFSLLSAEAEDRIRHEDYTMEWPQSGERLRGRQTMKAQAYPDKRLYQPRTLVEVKPRLCGLPRPPLGRSSENSFSPQ
jgi:hypothetical protein